MSFKSIEIEKFGGPEVLQVKINEALPEPAAGRVVIKVLATSAAYTDTLIRTGRYPELKDNPPLTPGYDVVGVVHSIGTNVTTVSVGQTVAALTVIGGYSEYMIVSADQLVLVPEGVDPAEAVSLVLSYITAYQMLIRSAHAESGDKILIHGAAGAVGSALVQLGPIFGLTMYGTAAKDQHAYLREYGCHPIDYKSEDFAEVLRRTESQGLDAVFDPIAGTTFDRSLRLLNKEGVVVVYGFLEARSTLGMAREFLRIKIRDMLPWVSSTSFYSIGAWHKAHFDWFEEDLTTLLGFLAEGKLKPKISEMMKLEDASKAHELLEQGGINGKIVLVTDFYRDKYSHM